MVTLIPQNQLDITGVQPSFFAPDAEGVRFSNDGYTYLIFANANVTTDRSFAVPAQRGAYGTGLPVSFPAPGTNEVGRDGVPQNAYTNSPFFDPHRFNDGAGFCYVTFDNVADITVACIRMGRAGYSGIQSAR